MQLRPAVCKIFGIVTAAKIPAVPYVIVIVFQLLESQLFLWSLLLLTAQFCSRISLSRSLPSLLAVILNPASSV
jgi:hypothetical protein